MKGNFIKITIVISGLVFISCGKNIYSSFESEPAAESATIALEEQKPDKAIAILEKAIAKDSSGTNYQLTSLLASAKAQKAGVDTIDLVLNLVNSSQSNSSDNGIVAMFTIMPEATSNNISLVTEARDLLISIPEASRTEADLFRLSMYYTAIMVLQTKALDLDGDGSLNANDLLAMSEQDAIAIISNLASAGSLLAEYSGEGGNATAANGVSAIYRAVEGTEGSSQKEKLSNYLSN